MAEAEDTTTIPTHITSVVRVEDRGPWYRRITFAGGDLATTYASIAPDEFVYVLLPPPGRTSLTIDASFSWLDYYGMPVEEQPVGAYYTVRSFDPATTELVIDVFLHEIAGHASGWARRAAPGDPAALWGPRTTFRPPVAAGDGDGVGDGDGDGVDWWLLVADESGLPALEAVLESLPAGADVHAFVELPSAATVPLVPAGVTVLERGDAEAGTTTALHDAVRALVLPDGRPYVWGGGESRVMTSIRKYLRKEVGYPRDRVSLTAYWRHQDHADDPEEPED